MNTLSTDNKTEREVERKRAGLSFLIVNLGVPWALRTNSPVLSRSWPKRVLFFFYRRELPHQLNKTCVQNMSCDNFNQCVQPKAKHPQYCFCHMRQNRHCLPLNRTVKQHICMLLQNLRSQDRGGLEYFLDLQRRSGCRAKFIGVGVNRESKI